MAYTLDDITQVRRKVGDRSSPFRFDETDYRQFLTDASGNHNGAAALVLQAMAVEEAIAWTTVDVGSVKRSKTNPADALMKLAESYAAQSNGTVTLDDTKAPAYGVARVDLHEHITDRQLPQVVDAEARRIRAEELTG